MTIEDAKRAVVAMAEIVAGSREQCDEDGTMIAVSRQALEELLALISALQADESQAVEPWGWFWQHGADHGVLTMRQDYDDHRSRWPDMEFTPLFTRPAAEGSVLVPREDLYDTANDAFNDAYDGASDGGGVCAALRHVVDCVLAEAGPVVKDAERYRQIVENPSSHEVSVRKGPQHFYFSGHAISDEIDAALAAAPAQREGE